METRIKRQFRRFHIGKEFYELDAWGESLLYATYELYHYEYVECKRDHVESSSFKQRLDLLIRLVANHKLNTSPSAEDKAAFEPISLLLDEQAKNKTREVMDIISELVLGR